MESSIKSRILTAANYLNARWWLLFFPVLIALILGLIILFFNPSIYESKATFVIRPRTNLSGGEDFVRALDTLIGRVEINETFAKIAESKLVRNSTIENLGISEADRQFYSTNAAVIIGTNLLEITARGNDPETVRDFVDTVGIETVKYIENLYDVFELEPLDHARLPRTPENFSSRQIILLLLLLGFLISIGLIVITRIYLHRQTDYPEFNITDPETGAFNRDYFIMRLGEELNRIGKLESPFVLSLIRFVVHDLSFDQYQFEGWSDDMRVIKQSIDKCINDGDILARYDEQTFSILFLDTSEEDYQIKLREIREYINNLRLEYILGGRSFHANGALCFVFYQHNDVVSEAKEIQDFADYAIAKAGKYNSSRIVELLINYEGEINESVADLYE